jgi:hypothetical protein
MQVTTLVERGSRARSAKIDEVSARAIDAVLALHAPRKIRLAADEATWYRDVGEKFA